MNKQPMQWERSDTSRIPFAVYTQDDTHKKEDKKKDDKKGH